MKSNLAVFLILIAFSHRVFAERIAQVKDVVLQNRDKQNGELEVILNGPFESTPEITLKNRVLQILLPETIVWPKIEKDITITDRFDTKLMAYQYEKNKVRIRAVLPFSVDGIENKISLSLKGNSVFVHFPLKNTFVPKEKSVSTSVKNLERFDENYLDRLIEQKIVGSKKTELALPVEKDKITMGQSAVIKEESEKKPNFSILSYAGKFLGFLAIMIAGLYFFANLLRKGVLKKGRLNFLNTTSIVEVLNTTYIAPKKSVVLLKVHNQLFLVGSSDSGLNLISEIKDTTGVLKEGERQISGSNFDSSLLNGDEKEFKIKENINESANTENQNAKNREEHVKLSDQIKKKIKGLKPLQ